ncbi:hypothetical protein F5Y16DRAFT_268152 [Xylariaceae sp. FL0255]|nr:hypothetical protein F5Y16DRAFT_268152 [Xylariaceae sp. FL0255]
MGGLAFASGPHALVTPQMPADVYRTVLERVQSQLRREFIAVATPIPAPAKKTYGDIDILVAWKKETPSTESQHLLDNLSTFLGAHRYKREGSDGCTMAIHWPTDLLPEGQKDLFIQVDVHLCEDMEHMLWMLFKHAHGDLWNIVGSVIRPMGLTIDEVGLYIRLPEIEYQDKKRAKMLLTKDPSEVLDFLGFQIGDVWEQPFASENDLFNYIASSNIFRFAMAAGVFTEDTVTNVQAMTANDRRRMKFRPVYQNFIENFIPSIRSDHPVQWTKSAARDAILRAAFHRFPGTEETYHAALEEWRLEVHGLQVWKDIKNHIPKGIDPEFRGHVLSGLKKIVMKGGSLCGLQAPQPLQDSDGFFDEARVYNFVQTRWKIIGEVSQKALRRKLKVQKKEKRLQKAKHKGKAEQTLLRKMYRGWVVDDCPLSEQMVSTNSLRKRTLIHAEVAKIMVQMDNEWQDDDYVMIDVIDEENHQRAM